mgnify:CR=1 FL=1
MGKTIFVTVGSTHFDSLISFIDTQEFISEAKTLGYDNIIAQIGSYPDKINNLKNTFHYSAPEQIKENFEKADLVIGHAGAGTILEVLQLGKPLIVVVNDTLMENHQTELARECAQKGVLRMATISSLVDVMREENPGHRIAFNGEQVISLLDEHFHFPSERT